MQSCYKSSVKNAKVNKNKTINGIMLQIFRKKRESQQKQK